MGGGGKQSMLTIHVGLHKTGSTALQHTLSSMTKKELAGTIYRGAMSAAMNDGFMSFEPDSFGFRAAPARVPTVKHLRSGHDVVLSDEGFLGNAMIPEVGWVYRDANARALGMLDYFGDLTPFLVVLYVRPQHAWLESLYVQRVKWGWMTGRIDANEFAEKMMRAPFFRWSRLVEALLDAVGPDRLVVRPHVRSVDVSSDFLSLLNLNLPPRLRHHRSVNVSPTS